MSIILGIESTAHTFGVGIVENGKILANVKKTYTTEKGGIIPTDAAKHHRENKEKIYAEALEKAEIKEQDIDAIAFSQGPGLAPCLLEGIKFAKEISLKLKIPLVPVNHCISHLEIGKITGAKDPVMLYVSGANTQIISFEEKKYRIFGETLDIGVGNFIDNFARFLGLGFPGGPKIQELAEQGKNYVELPYCVKGMDITLSGILTNLKQKIEKLNKLPAHLHSQIDKKLLNKNQLFSNHLAINSNKTDIFNNKFISSKARQKNNENDIEYLFPNNKKNRKDSNGMEPNLLIPCCNYFNKSKYLNVSSPTSSAVNYTIADLAYSMQETVFAMLVETAERALAHTGKRELLLGGGVACNKRLQEMCRIMCDEREEKVKLFIPENSLLIDNGAMIAYLGEIMFNAGIKFSCKDLDEIDIKPRQRTDDVDVGWK